MSNKVIIFSVLFLLVFIFIGSKIASSPRQFNSYVWAQTWENAELMDQRYRMKDDLVRQLSVWSPDYKTVVQVLGSPDASNIDQWREEGHDKIYMRYSLGRSMRLYVIRTPYYLMLNFNSDGRYGEAGIHPE